MLASRKAARADGKVLLAKRRENVGERLQGTRDLRLERERGAEPDAGDEERKRPADLGRVVPRPEQNERHEDGGKPREQGGEQDAPLVPHGHAAPPLIGHDA
jgi:hypothetical protein